MRLKVRVRPVNHTPHESFLKIFVTHIFVRHICVFRSVRRDGFFQNLSGYKMSGFLTLRTWQLGNTSKTFENDMLMVPTLYLKRRKSAKTRWDGCNLYVPDLSTFFQKNTSKSNLSPVSSWSRYCTTTLSRVFCVIELTIWTDIDKANSKLFLVASSEL